MPAKKKDMTRVACQECGFSEVVPDADSYAAGMSHEDSHPGASVIYLLQT